MKQNTYNKGRNKNFTPKSKKFKSQPLKEDFDKKETIEETLDQRLNNVIDKNKAISELIIGHIKELQTNRKKFQHLRKPLLE